MVRKEKGYILVVTLVIMTISAIIIGSYFLYLNASLAASSRTEERSVTYYAADTGFEDAVFWLKQDKILPEWNQTGNHTWQRELYEVYGRTVNVSVIEDADTLTYKVTSTATTNSSMGATIEAYIALGWFDLSPFGENAITSNGDVDILGQKGGVQGNVTYVGELECSGDPFCEESINGSITQEDELDFWPETSDITEFFLSEVEDVLGDPFLEDTIDVSVTHIIGPLYREGDLLIDSSVKGASTTLNGTIYVTGDVVIGGSKDFTLNLNQQSIFVEGDEEHTDYAIKFGEKCTIDGSGAIIALGNIDFGPKIQTGEDDFVFLMSVEGETQLNPMNDFYGSIGGNADVDLFPGVNLIWNDPADAGYEFPQGEYFGGILTYDIIE
jgi:hypothetical protein